MLTVEPGVRRGGKSISKKARGKGGKHENGGRPPRDAGSDASQIPVIVAPPLGPLGDLLSEVLEELVSGSLHASDAVDVDLIHVLARLYVERCQYRRSQELFERANYLSTHGAAGVDLGSSQPWAFLASHGVVLDGEIRAGREHEGGKDGDRHDGDRKEDQEKEEEESSAASQREELSDTMLLTLEQGLPGGALAFMTTKTVSSTAGGTMFKGRRQRALFQAASPSPHRLPPSDAEIEFVRKQARERSVALKELQRKSRSMPTFDASGRARGTGATTTGGVAKVSTKLAVAELHTQLTSNDVAANAAKHDLGSSALWRDQVGRDKPPKWVVSCVV